MTHILEDEQKTFTAITNREEQYSFWPTDLDVPSGWSRTGPTGSREEVLTFIDTTWKDMRPRTLRELA